MKKLLTIILVAGALTQMFIACNNNENIDPDAYYERLEIHDTLVIYNDTYVYNEATYFSQAYKDSIFKVNEKWDNYPNISLHADSRLVIDSLNNVSIKYIGGWANRTNPEDPESLCDCFNDHEYISNYVPGQVIIYDDTIYKERTIPVSYAIFEITDGQNILIDTAVYGQCVEIKEIHNEMESYDDEMTYFEKFSDYYYNYTFSVDYNLHYFSEKRHQTFFSNFDKIPLKFKNSKGSYDLYLVDIFPYWNNNMTQNKVLYYVYIPDVMLYTNVDEE